MNSSEADINFTGTEQNEINMDHIIGHLRLLFIEDFYGPHYRLIFYVSLVICIIGYVTNTLNIIVFSRTSLSNSMNLFLLLLAVSDIALITTQFAHIVHYFAGFKMYPYYSHYVFTMVCTFFESIFDNASNWFVTVVAIWRYVVVTWPQTSTKWFSKGRVQIIVVLISVCSILLAFPMFLFYTHKSILVGDHVFYDKILTEFALTNYNLPLKVYWAFLLLRGLVPIIIMATATGGLVYVLCKSCHGKHKDTGSYKINVRVTVMLTVLLVLFLLSNFPDSCLILVTLISGGDKYLQQEYREATDIVRVFMLANNSLSFFIYYGLGYEFRKVFKSLFCRCVLTRERRDSVAESTVGEMGDVSDKNKTAHKMVTVGV